MPIAQTINVIKINIMKTKGFFLAMLFAMFSFSTSAQTQFDLQFANPTYMEEVDSFCVTIQIKSSDEQVFTIGSHTFFFNYNTNSINFPTYQSLAFDSTFLCEVAPTYNVPVYYRPRLGASTDSGDANVTTIMLLRNLGCPEVGSEWVDAGIVCFAVIDPTQSVNLRWNEEKTDVNFNDDTPRHDQGELMGLNVRPDGMIPDSDGDGLNDEVEAAINSNPENEDSDGDGILDGDEYAEGGTNDTDGDEILDILDRDDDGDGVLTADEGDVDTDGDETPDYLDTDDDDDGVLTTDELPVDTDGDGVDNFRDDDDDGDGRLTVDEGTTDTDGDETPDYLDNDDDGDTVLTVDELDEDTDDDGIPNYLDDDDDGDGFPTADEGADDVDGDGIANYLDAEVTGIEEDLANQLQIELYPNPNSGNQLSVMLEGEGTSSAKVLKVYDVKGTLVQELTSLMYTSNNTLLLNTSTFASGIYFVNVYDATDKVIGQSKLVMTR